MKAKLAGVATVKRVFSSPRLGDIAGCFVWTGGLRSLRRFKDSVTEVRENHEMGVVLDCHPELKMLEGDRLEFWECT